MGDRQEAQVWVTDRPEPGGWRCWELPGVPSSCQWGGSPLPAAQQGTGGPSAGRSGSSSYPLVSRCERGSQPPPLLSSERSAGSDAAGELSHVGQWFFFFP